MEALSVTYAIGHVRRSLDELETNASAMLGQEMDGASIDVICAACLPEAVEYVHRNAPLALLDGIAAEPDDMEVLDGGVYLEIRMKRKMERLLYVRCSGSGNVVTTAVQEDSPEGRMQLNPYTRGTYDSPVLVRMASGEGLKPVFRYYSPRTQGNDMELHLGYIPHQDKGLPVYMVSGRAVNAVLDRLVGLVLYSFSEADKAAIYFSKADKWDNA